ncbi:MAG: DUF481 domain-containing protein [Gammaproteobacteria bacterium]|nr:DUF481 domain-containing protein [Gammaproteobacteria bacterium]
MKKSVTLLAAALLMACNAYAEEDADAKSLWKASAELGYVATSGNSETESLNAKAMASTDRQQWRHKGEVTALRASNTDDFGVDVITAEKYTLMGQSDYKLEGKNFLFGVINYENDKFSGYDYRVTEAIGYGRRVVEDSDLVIDLEIGPGARQSKVTLTGKTESEQMLRAAAILNWAVSKTSNFGEALTVEAGEDVTVTKSVTSLSSQINGSLSMKITYTYKNTSEVPVGVEDTDTETAVTLVYNF